LDQPLSLPAIGRAADIPVADAQIPAQSISALSQMGIQYDGGYWYDLNTGFVGRVVNAGGTIYVVYRGTDGGTKTDYGSIFDFFRTGQMTDPVGNFDLLDW